MDIDTDSFERQRILKFSIVGILALSIGSIVAVDYFMVDKQVNTFQANATAVTPDQNQTSLGLVADRNLNFGQVPVGAAVRKNINIEADSGSKVSIGQTGNISDHLITDMQSTSSGYNIEVTFNASEPGLYEGNVNVKTQSPKNGLAAAWLRIKP